MFEGETGLKNGKAYRLTTTVTLERKSRNTRVAAGVYTHTLLLNYEAQKSTITYYSKKTS